MNDLTKKEIVNFAAKISNGRLTKFLSFFIPDIYDKGTIVTDVLEPNFEKMDNWAEEVSEELEKKATKTQLGRIKIGNNLTVDEDGTLHGNPGYTHPTGNGNNHIPVNGATGNFLKWLSSGAAQWVNITWDDIGSKPSSFPTGTHTHDDRYYTESEIDTKFKNFCPYQIGDIYLTTNSTNPSSTFLGTTWQKIEGRFLLGTSGSGASKATGGSNSKTIAQANLPNVKLTVNSFSLSRGTQNITGYIDKVRVRLNNDFGAGGAFSGSLSTLSGDANSGSAYTTKYDFDASKTWTGSTNSVSPQTSALGSGSALDITPAYYTVHMWLRLT